MSQPRRRRRRRRKGSPSASAPAQQRGEPLQGQPDAQGAVPGSRRRRRGRRGAGGGRERSVAPSSATASLGDTATRETKRRVAVMAPPDGRTLEGVIGELQSEWGVPQYPQEYRLTIKVAEERDLRGGTAAIEEVREEPGVEREEAARIRRERAPAAPRIAAGAGAESSRKRDDEGRKRVRRRRRRRGGT